MKGCKKENEDFKKENEDFKKENEDFKKEIKRWRYMCVSSDLN
jgi:FtsZ-binding cell division protein ZapB